jgi:HAD superfamily hydrolase (TIGR01509 family)
VILDLDGLMVDSEPLAEWAWDQFLDRYGHELDPQTALEILGMRVIDSARFICRRFELPIDPQSAADGRDQIFLEVIPTRLRACTGFYPLLDELTSREIPLGIATSGHRRYVRLALQTLGVQDRFQAIAAGDEVERGKPAPDVYLLAATRLGMPPNRCLVLEDTPLGVAAGRTAGMVCVAVPNRRTAALEFAEAHQVFRSLEEVHRALDELLELEASALAEERNPVYCYVAAGGVVVEGDHVLVLQRPSRNEVRLPKGRVEPGESAQTAALREVREESGYTDLVIRGDLGTQIVTFDHQGRHVVRTERYFLMRSTNSPHCGPPDGGEEQFEPVWMTSDEALAALTFEAEREWVRRALSLSKETTTEENRVQDPPC